MKFLTGKVARIYTDGSARHGAGGWAAIIQRNNISEEIWGAEPEGATSNRMELTAAIKALEWLGTERHQVYLITDSKYLQLGISAWIHLWKLRGWQTAEGSPVINRDLWEHLDALQSRHVMHWGWVKGHTGEDPLNDRCDFLAMQARCNQLQESDT